MIFLHKIIGLKLVVVLLMLGMGAGLFHLSGTYKVHALNVHAEIKANPPGIVRIIDQTGNPPSGIVNPTGTQPPLPTSGTDANISGTGLTGDNQGGSTPPDDNGDNEPEGTSASGQTQSQTTPLPPGMTRMGGGGGAGGGGALAQDAQSSNSSVLTIIDDIDFGTVFPEELLEESFFVTITTPDTIVTYNITMLSKTGFENMLPHVIVYKNPSEIDTETDPTANGTDGDYIAKGTLNSYVGDWSDEWIVKFDVPDALGNYWMEIEIQAP